MRTDTSRPVASNLMKRILLSLSAATARVPFSAPHCDPRTQVAPEVAKVGSPERQRAPNCLPGSEKSVIGTDSL